MPEYYGDKIQPIHVITANKSPFIEGNVLKCLFRAGLKTTDVEGVTSDLNKVIHYILLEGADTGITRYMLHNKKAMDRFDELLREKERRANLQPTKVQYQLQIDTMYIIEAIFRRQVNLLEALELVKQTLHNYQTGMSS